MSVHQPNQKNLTKRLNYLTVQYAAAVVDLTQTAAVQVDPAVQAADQ